MAENIPAPILNSGGPPPQRHLFDRTWGLDEERMLLFAAWAYGMTAEDVAHRYAIFAFVQTHLSRKSEEQLQRTIETSADWEGQGKGKYKLTERGLNRVVRLFGQNPVKSSLIANYVLTRAYEGRDFTVQLQPASHKVAVFIDGDAVRGVDACQRLENLGVIFNTKSNSRTSRVWNWIVQEGPFSWQRQ